MDYIEKTVRKNYVYQGKILNLRNDDAERPDGRPCKREIIEHSAQLIRRLVDFPYANQQIVLLICTIERHKSYTCINLLFVRFV